MKKLCIVILMILSMVSIANAQTWYSWRYRSHATDCTALTDGKLHDICFEIDDETTYKCEPDAGDCTGTEWKLLGTKEGSFGITLDGGGSAITTGVKGYIEIPFGLTISTATLVCDQSGSIVVDVWKDTYANYPPVDADTITSSTPPTITTALKSQDTTLTSWTTTVTTGDVVGFNVDSATTVTFCTLTLSGDKT